MGTRAPLPQKADDFGEIIRMESKGLAMHLCKLSCLVPLESPCRLCGGGGGGGEAVHIPQCEEHCSSRKHSQAATENEEANCYSKHILYTCFKSCFEFC